LLLAPEIKTIFFAPLTAELEVEAFAAAGAVEAPLLLLLLPQAANPTQHALATIAKSGTRLVNCIPLPFVRQ
jgi:hypothetical protein